MALEGLSVFERGTLPNWLKVRQQLYAGEIVDIDAAVAEQFQRPEIAATITPGMRVAVGAGSRGIDRIDKIVRATVDQIKLRGAEPFVFPAMGSHGGATVEGQINLLDHYGISESTMGCPVKASMDTVELGMVEGDVQVYFDRIAYQEADAVIPVGRVKPHTDFYGPIESGLMKMIAIGMGKQKGADTFHSRGFPEFHTLIPAVGLSTLSHVNIPFGMALVENGYGHMSIIEAVPAKGMLEREKELLKLAREWLGRLPGEKIDILLVDEIGKNISGDGADPNVINRDVSGEILKIESSPRPEIHRVIFRDLTVDTEGNACGIGMGDFVLRQLADKVDPTSTYMNVITSKYPAGGRLPMVVDNDRQAIFLALGSAHMVAAETSKIARIRNTKDVEDFWISEPLLPQMLASGRVEQLTDPKPIAFDNNGMLATF